MPEINKVIFGDTTLVDMTDATAEAGDIVSGKTAYLRSGERGTGTLDSKQAASGGTDLSLVTTGEKYTWNSYGTSISNILGDFASVEASITASKAYSRGDRLVLGDVLYRVTTAIALGGTIVTTGNNANVVAVTVDSEMKRRRIWFKNITVSAQATEGTLIDAQDADIDSDYILEGGDVGIHWGDSSKITTLSSWSTNTPGHFIVTGTCSAQTTATFALVLAEKQHDYTT